jgi:hypothetical protein
MQIWRRNLRRHPNVSQGVSAFAEVYKQNSGYGTKYRLLTNGLIARNAFLLGFTSRSLYSIIYELNPL